MENTKAFLCSIVIALLVAGCGTTSNQRIEMLQDSLKTAQQITNDSMLLEETLRDTIQKAQAMLAEDETLSESERQSLHSVILKAQEKLTVLQQKRMEAAQKITEILAAIQEAAEGNPSRLGQELEIYGKTITSLSPYLGSWAMYGHLAGILLATVGGYMARRKSTEAKETEETLKQVISSVDILLEKMDEKQITSKDAKQILKENQTPSASYTVDVIKAEKKIQ